MNVLGLSVSEFKYAYPLDDIVGRPYLSAEKGICLNYRKIAGVEEGNSSVVEVESSLDLKRYALKIFKPSDVTAKNEIPKIRRLNQKEEMEGREFIVRLIAYFVLGNQFSFLMPLYKSSLFEVVKSVEKVGLSLERTLNISRQIFEILIFLKKHRVIHRDIKPENLLVVNERDEIRLGDFGFAMLEGDSVIKVSGTEDYLSPEVLASSDFGFASDIWATACTIAIMIKGSYLFDLGENKVDFRKKLFAQHKYCFEKIFSLELKGRIYTFDRFMKRAFVGKLKKGQVEFKELLKSLFEFDPKERPSPEEALDRLKMQVDPAFARNFQLVPYEGSV